MRMYRTLNLIMLYFLIGFLYPSFSQTNFDKAQKLARENQYARAIYTLANNGSVDKLKDKELVLLGQVFLLQAKLYRDLYELQLAIGSDYLEYRETNKSTVLTKYDPFFRGRYLFESGQYKKAETALLKAFNQGHDKIKAKAGIWLEAARIQQGKRAAGSNEKFNDNLLSLEHLFAMWETGRTVKKLLNVRNTSSIIEKRLALWAASQNRDLSKIIQLMSKVANSYEPDAVKNMQNKYKLNFYDPSTLRIIYFASYVAAAEIFQRIKNIKYQNNKNYFSGLCWYEAGDYIKAKEMLENMSPMTQKANIYLGAVYYRLNQIHKANELWKGIKESGNPDILALYCQILQPLDEKQGLIKNTCIKLKYKVKSTEAILAASRCLIYSGMNQTAFQILNKYYPVSKHNKVRYIQPSYLILFSHSKYLQGRKYYSDVLSHLAAVNSAGYNMLPILNMARAYMAPENPLAGREKRISY